MLLFHGTVWLAGGGGSQGSAVHTLLCPCSSAPFPCITSCSAGTRLATPPPLTGSIWSANPSPKWERGKMSASPLHSSKTSLAGREVELGELRGRLASQPRGNARQPVGLNPRSPSPFRGHDHTPCPPGEGNAQGWGSPRTDTKSPFTSFIY